MAQCKDWENWSAVMANNNVCGLCMLQFLKDGLTKLRVPYAYGFAIILLTFLVKAATYPLTKSQVESTLAMQNLNPKIKAIQQRYQGDQVVTSLQQMFLCRKA
jgi:YidC/Oxa1 family membrane protein insertase